MDSQDFQGWLSAAGGLTRAQRREALAVLSGRSAGEASKAAIELAVDEARRCPHCAREGAVSRGKARGLRRYQCKGCGKTFNALTGTPLSGLHHKERWLSFGASLAEGETVKASAEHRPSRFARPLCVRLGACAPSPDARSTRSCDATRHFPPSMCSTALELRARNRSNPARFATHPCVVAASCVTQCRVVSPSHPSLRLGLDRLHACHRTGLYGGAALVFTPHASMMHILDA